MAFYPGQQVVCVNARTIPGASNWYIYMLEEGNVYTVRDIAKHVDYKDPGYGLRLDSVWLPKSDRTGFEETWHPLRFRPCAKTDISELAALLNKIPADTVDA